MLLARRLSLSLLRQPQHLGMAPCSTSLFSTMQQRGDTEQDRYFRDLQRKQLSDLKKRQKLKLKPIDESNEFLRLANILEHVEVRQEIRKDLSVQLLLWKHDEDLLAADK